MIIAAFTTKRKAMIKTIAQMELSIEKWESFFHCHPDTPLHIAEQMFLKGLQILGKIKEEADKAQAAAKEAEKVKEESENPPVVVD
jgi:hypothetical protein